MNSKMLFNTTMNVFFTIFVITIVIFLGPVNAVNISINTNSLNPQYDETISFLVNIDIDTNERIPISDIRAIIKDENNNIVSECYFDVDGNKLSNCGTDFILIDRVDYNVNNYNIGNLIGEGYGNNGSKDSNYTTTFGYGYGYGSGVNVQDELKYNIQWRTPAIQSEENKYIVYLEVNSKNSNGEFVYKVLSPIQINVSMDKPLAKINNNYFEIFEGEKVYIDADESLDPNNFSIVEYKIFDESNNLVINSSDSIFSMGVNHMGNSTFSLVVRNEHNIISEPVEFEIFVDSSFSEKNFKFNVNPYVPNGDINFEIISDAKYINKVVKVKPVITCMNIDFRYNEEFMNSELILDEANKSYSLKVSRSDFKLNIPYDVNCDFKVILHDELNDEDIELLESLKFSSDIAENSDSEVPLATGNELFNYLSSSFSKKFDKGFNSIEFNMKNTGSIDIDAEMKVIVAGLDFEYDEEMVIKSNSAKSINIPLYISEDTQKGKYPIRFSYKLNNGDVRVRYGFLIVQ